VSRGVQIILPGLFDLPLQELDARFIATDLPALNRILGLSSVRDNSDFTIDAMLSSTLNMKLEVSEDGASGAEAGAGEASWGEARWARGLAMAQACAEDHQDPRRLLLAEAIHLQADMHGAIAVPISNDNENLSDIEIIINDLGDLFNVDCDIRSIGDGRFLLQLKQFDSPTHYPHPLSILGKSISPFIEQSREILPWYRLVNEFQMFMYQHPVNQRRQLEGRLMINSLWVWGAGERPTLDLQPQWYCDDPLLNRFASSLGLAVESCRNIAAGDDSNDAVIVDLRLLQYLKSGLDWNLDELLLDIERSILGPALKSLPRRPGPLKLRAGYRLDFELKSADRFKFWRRPGSLETWRQATS
jgi:hypothetical protein